MPSTSQRRAGIGEDRVIELAAVASGLVTLAALPLMLRVLERTAIIDTPNARSSHSKPTLRGGGIAPVIGASFGAMLLATSDSRDLMVVATVAVAFSLIGLADDIRSLSPMSRLVVQGLVGAGAAAWLSNDLAAGFALVVLVPGITLWLVGFVNVFNFMDGINGISAVQTIAAGAAWAAVGSWQDQSEMVASGLIVAAAASAFLPFNFPRARVFPGDVGSYFFGAWLAAVAVLAVDAGFTPEMAVAPLVLYLSDTGTTLVRRFARGERLTEPHRDHVYQQLVIGGWSHTEVTGLVGILILLCSALGAVSMTGHLAGRTAADVAIVALVAAYLMAPRWQRTRRLSIEPTR